MSAVLSYDPASVVISIGGANISGFTDGTFCEVARDEPSYTKVVGADGVVSRAKTNNRSGTVTITLKQTSPSNDILSALLTAAELTNTPAIPIIIKDTLGTSVYFAAQGWVGGYANSTFGKEITDRSWTIMCGEMDVHVGSND
jgi:hypothetical protein